MMEALIQMYQRDTLINACTLARCGREYYTQEENNQIDHLFDLRREICGL